LVRNAEKPSDQVINGRPEAIMSWADASVACAETPDDVVDSG
jgi:hypothetical protein